LAYLWLKFAVFELLLDLLERLEVFPVCEDIVQTVQLFVSVPEFSLHGLKLPYQDLSVPLDDRPDDPKEGQLFSLLTAQELPIELDELKEDAFEQGLSVLGALLLVHQGNESVVDKPRRNVVVSEVDEFKQPPCIEHRKDGPFDSE
jgi:hypothetical protein